MIFKDKKKIEEIEEKKVRKKTNTSEEISRIGKNMSEKDRKALIKEFGLEDCF